MSKKLLKNNKKLIIANWKMNPNNIRDAKKIFGILKKKNLRLKKSIAVLCPPTVFLNGLTSNYRGDKFSFGAQNVSWTKDGKSTGEISTDMLRSLGVRLVIVGHSERRAIGDTSEIVAKKVKRIMEAGLTPVLCVGENARDADGEYLRFVAEELHYSLSKISRKDISKIVIAYEPVWTIGKGKKAVYGYELHQMIIFIKKILSKIYNKKIAMEIPILYGGSVDADNCDEILDSGDIDGLLVGRASLNPHVFADILKCVDK